MDKTDHFVHELISFAKSPLDMVAYDNKVCYDFPTRSNELLAGMDLSSQECSSTMTQQRNHDHSSLGINNNFVSHHYSETLHNPATLGTNNNGRFVSCLDFRV